MSIPGPGSGTVQHNGRRTGPASRTGRPPARGPLTSRFAVTQK